MTDCRLVKNVEHDLDDFPPDFSNDQLPVFLVSASSSLADAVSEHALDRTLTHARLAAARTVSPRGEQASNSWAVTRMSTSTSWRAVGTKGTI